MVKRLIVFAAAALMVIAPAVAAAPAQAASPKGVGCALAGSAVFKPGLTTTAKKFAYTFSGALTNCHSTDATVKSGKATAKGSGTGTCANSTGAGVAAIKWNNGKVTAVKFTTTGAGAAVQVATTVVKSVVIGVTTYYTTEPATAVGNQGDGVLAFQADATKCTTTAGLTTATFNGPIASGNYQ